MTQRQTLYYVQDGRHYVGDCITWRTEDGNVTADLEQAKLYSREEAQNLCLNGAFRAWPFHYTSAMAIKTVNIRTVDKKISRTWRQK